jgi:uncharacterized membrane protein
MKKFLIAALLSLPFILSISHVHAQQYSRVLVDVVKGQVVEIISKTENPVAGSDKVLIIQNLKVKLLSGDKAGQVVTVENDHLKLQVGEKVLLNHLNNNGVDLYSVNERERRPFLLFLLFIFIAVIIWFGGWQGARSLVSMGVAFLAMIYVLLPALLKGYSPVLISTAISVFVLFLAIYFTHGFNKDSTVAFAGTVASVAVTAILAALSIYFSKLTGFYSEDAFKLDFQIPAQLDFVGLLQGGIIIGALGFLTDNAVTQVAVVRELFASAAHLANKEIYRKAMRVGKEHVSALVHTLVFAYAGGTLPLLILFSTAPYGFSVIANQEQFAAEIIRTIIGSIGLILTVPITTALAVYLLNRSDKVEQLHQHHH